MGEGLCPDGHLLGGTPWDAMCCCANDARPCCPDHGDVLFTPPSPHLTPEVFADGSSA